MAAEVVVVVVVVRSSDRDVDYSYKTSRSGIVGVSSSYVVVPPQLLPLQVCLSVCLSVHICEGSDLTDDDADARIARFSRPSSVVVVVAVASSSCYEGQLCCCCCYCSLADWLPACLPWIWPRLKVCKSSFQQNRRSTIVRAIAS